jgi:hypothetical protein
MPLSTPLKYSTVSMEITTHNETCRSSIAHNIPTVEKTSTFGLRKKLRVPLIERVLFAER